MSKSQLLELTPVEAVACCSPLARQPLTQAGADQIAPLLKALADPVRLRLMSLIASHEGGEACVCDLTDAFELSQPTISHHLKVLHEAGPHLARQARCLGLLPRPDHGARGSRHPDRDAVAGTDAATVPLARQALAELIGTAFLLMAIVGSGIAAVRLSPGNVGLQLLENSVVTGAALVALILALHPVSAAFNPLVTLVDRRPVGHRHPHAVALVVAQVVGAIVGCGLANLMFGPAALELSGHQRDAAGIRLGEVVATPGLLLVIAGTVRSGRGERVAVAVGAYIVAAYWFTSSTSFANPAVTIARIFSDSFAGIAPASAAVPRDAALGGSSGSRSV